LVTSNPIVDAAVGQTRALAIRPEAIVLEPPTSGRNSLAAMVEDVDFLGAVVRIRVRMDTVVISLDVFNDPHRALPQRGENITLGFSFDNLLVLEETA